MNAKIVLSDGLYIADKDNYGLAEGWSPRLADAMPMPADEAVKIQAVFARLLPGKIVIIEDATPGCIGRPISAERLEELRASFVAGVRSGFHR